MASDIISILNDISTKLDSIQRSTAVLADIVDPYIGIERIWPNRRAWVNDPSDGMAAWKKRVCQAKEVEIVSMTLWTNWFQDTDFRGEFFESLARGTTARILIYDPHADVLKLRAADERSPRGQMQAEIEWTLEAIACGRETLDAAAPKNLQVRLTNRFYHLAQIIRADDRILVGVYLSGKIGGSAPSFQVKGPETAFYQAYHEQIDILWKRGREVSDNELDEPVTKPHLPPLPTLRQLLTDCFNEGELRDLCFDLRVDYENLSGAGKGDKARELVAFFERRGLVSVLIGRCEQLRPNVFWWDAL